jgi:ATP-dependent protease Clp ATPase subunit
METRTGYEKARRCSWCHKSQDEVAVLIATPVDLPRPRAYICDECVAVCNSLLEERGIETIDMCRARLANRIGAANSADTAIPTIPGNSANSTNTVQEGAIQ